MIHRLMGMEIPKHAKEEEAEQARFLKQRRRMADRRSDKEFMRVLEAIYAGKDSNFDDKPDGIIYRLPWRSEGSVWPGHQALLVITKRSDQWSPVITIEDIPTQTRDESL